MKCQSSYILFTKVSRQLGVFCLSSKGMQNTLTGVTRIQCFTWFQRKPIPRKQAIPTPYKYFVWLFPVDFSFCFSIEASLSSIFFCRSKIQWSLFSLWYFILSVSVNLVIALVFISGRFSADVSSETDHPCEGS